MPTSGDQAKTQEEKDEEELREIEKKIHEVLDLMTNRKNREELDTSLEQARARRDEHSGNITPVVHISKTVHAATTMHTKTHLDLADNLKTRIALGQYALRLDDSLRRLSERYVEVLERILTRSRY